MLQSDTLKFLKSLKKNNNKAWMDVHRDQYEKAKADFIAFVNKLITELSKSDNSLDGLNAKDCIFRINRDVRFSKNKSPYKNNFAAYLNKNGKKGTGAGYYIHIEPGACFIAAGVWMPEAKELSNIRQEIDYNYEEWKKMLNAKNFKQHFKNGLDSTDILSRPPKGYSEDNPAIEYLKLKSFIARMNLVDEAVLQNKLSLQLNKAFSSIKPMVDFINRSQD